MNCQLEFVRQEGERFLHRCLRCKAEVRSKYRDPAMRKQTCGIRPPPFGPGSEFFAITRELGIPTKCGGECAKLLWEMNLLGVEGCRRERTRLLERLRANAAHYTFTEKAAGLWAALRQGKPLSLTGLYELAIERAAAAT